MTMVRPPVKTLAARISSPRTLDDVVAHVESSLARCDEYDGENVWIHRCTRDEIEAQLNRLSGLMVEQHDLPLLGVTLAVKDNIDVAGIPTTAACPAFSYTPQVSAAVIQRLCDAGAIVIGKTNMDQFATGLVGTRSPYGACQNHYSRKHISGGSSSGSAIAVAAGLCDAALGTDTAGSGRVPAGLNNIVGLKPSRGLISTVGVVPACRSLDCVSLFTRDVELAEHILGVAEEFDPGDIYSRRRDEITSATNTHVAHGFRMGIPRAADLEFFGDESQRECFGRATERLASMGAGRMDIDFGPFNETAQLLYEGAWVAERLVAIREFYHRCGEQMLPVTRSIIGKAESLTAADAFSNIYQLAALRKEARRQWSHMDVMVLPTVPTVYTIEQVNADPVQLNRNLGYYTNFVNLLDLCAIAIPAGFRPDGLPFGITLVVPAGNEPTLMEIARRFEGGAA